MSMCVTVQNFVQIAHQAVAEIMSAYSIFKMAAVRHLWIFKSWKF